VIERTNCDRSVSVCHMTSFHIFDLFSVEPDSNSIKNEIGHEKGQNKSPIYDHSSNTLVIFVLEIMTIKKVESVSNEEWDGEGEL
jgi:hypothetical protein